MLQKPQLKAEYYIIMKDTKTLHELLMEYAVISKISMSHLKRSYSDEIIQEALDNEYIQPIGVNDISDEIFIITQKGKDKRDH